MTKFKPLPIGVENFEDMIKENYYYIDKTLFIKDLLDQKGKVNLFTRPRRFGKTLSISMFQYFFENLKEDKCHLFDRLNIATAGEAYLAHQNKYPVIKISLKEASTDCFEDSFKKLVTAISGEFKRHGYLLEHSALQKSDQEKYQRIVSEEATYHDYSGSLKFISECLVHYYHEKVIILIDEYDVPLEKAHFNDFIRSFFSDALKTNDGLHFAVMTGCLRVSKESIFTGLNHLNIISILTDHYGEYFGFTEKEIDALLKYYELDDKADEIRDWYNGYLFGETTVYNPWSSVTYLSDVLYGKMAFPRPHWANTSSNSIVRELIGLADDETKNEIEALTKGETIIKPITEDIVYDDITKHMDNLWSFLFFTGYLKKMSKEQRGETIYLEMKIPNREVKYIYNRHLREWFDEKIKLVDLIPLYTAVLNQDVLIFQNELSDILMDTISYFDSEEAFYHGFLVGVLRQISGYIAKSNRESGNGRGDIFLRPVSIRKPAIVIEVKVAKKAQDLKKESDVALKQIEEKKYEDELVRDGYSQVIKYGIAFYRKDCEIKLGEISRR